MALTLGTIAADGMFPNHEIRTSVMHCRLYLRRSRLRIAANMEEISDGGDWTTL
jgi:hypothetical protein